MLYTFTAHKLYAKNTPTFICTLMDERKKLSNFINPLSGGEFIIAQRYKDMAGSDKMGEADRERMMHISLKITPSTTLMGSLTHLPAEDKNFCLATTITYVYRRRPEKEANKLFQTLSKDGKIEMPMNKTFWGSLLRNGRRQVWHPLDDKFYIPEIKSVKTMEKNNNTSKVTLWTSSILRWFVILFMLFDAIIKFIKPEPVIQININELGYKDHHILIHGLTALIPTLLFILSLAPEC